MPDVRESFCQVTTDKKGREIAHLYEGPKGDPVEVARSTPLHDETPLLRKIFGDAGRKRLEGDALYPVNGRMTPFNGHALRVERNADGTGECYDVLPGNVASMPYPLAKP